jgi:hypothetical protein
MKSIFHKIFSILLIPILLFSTTSFSVDKHICMDSVYSISIFGEADDCSMEMEHCDKLTLNYCILSDENSCKDVIEFIAGSTGNQEKQIQLNFEQTHFLLFIIFSKPNLNKTNSHKNYSSPKVVKNLYILNQVFKI